MHINWLSLALVDLDSIEAYIAQESLDAAVRVVLQVIESVELLQNQPNLGRIGRVDGTRELILTDTPYTVAYRVKNSSLEILRILHQSRQWPDEIPGK
ncbi:MAG: type II toxin-antitoxin system RelE/ParE family toxin [Deltaproteobacteria bacterium]|nr:MAG: type II toxin-antitoxin system RelE/ParE family toxin [Deltaproteobacteria bacterium]